MLGCSILCSVVVVWVGWICFLVILDLCHTTLFTPPVNSDHLASSYMILYLFSCATSHINNVFHSTAQQIIR